MSINQTDDIDKITYIASRGDTDSYIINSAYAIDSNCVLFTNKIKIISTNVYSADMIFGPIKTNLLSENKHQNTWYNILSNALKLTLRVNKHYIKEYEKKIIELQDKEKLSKSLINFKKYPEKEKIFPRN